MRVSIAILLALACAACDQAGPTAPTRAVLPVTFTPSPAIFVDLSGLPQAPNLPPNVPAIAGGDWKGIVSLMDTGEIVRLNVSGATVSQSDRTISGSWQGSSGIRGTFSGTLAGVGSDTRIAGTFTLTAPPCTLSGSMSGPAWPALIWWEIPTVTIPNCTGNIRDVRLTLYR